MILGLYVTIFKDPANMPFFGDDSRASFRVAIWSSSVYESLPWTTVRSDAHSFKSHRVSLVLESVGQILRETQKAVETANPKSLGAKGCKRTWRSYKPPANPFYDLIPTSCRGPKFMQQIPNLLWCISSPWNRWVHPLSLSRMGLSENREFGKSNGVP